MCYLSTWGMLRGSSVLLQKSAKFYEPLIRIIAGKKVKIDDSKRTIEGINQKIWNIDVDHFENQEIRNILLDTYNKIKICLYNEDKTHHIVAVTKIMLGIYGCIPAMDRYFSQSFSTLYGSFGFSKTPTNLLDKHLRLIYHFYSQNEKDINNLQKRCDVLKFNEQVSNRHYTKAKIIDMYGFNKSFIEEGAQ